MLKENNEMTARQIREKLYEKFPALNVSLATVKWVQKENGWVCTSPHYSQLIWEVSKLKQKELCQKQIDKKEKFSNVVFTDDQLDHHGQLCFRKKRKAHKLKQCAKHPAKVHIWGDISIHYRCYMNCNVYWYNECPKICQDSWGLLWTLSKKAFSWGS